jgi:gamma-glutamyl-gamma-aminobutyrate hydrolase PuuD
MRDVDGPRVVVTLSSPERAADRGVAELKNRRYLEALERAGAVAVPLDERAGAGERAAALGSMDALLITGGGDLDPARYAEPPAGAHPADRGRDELDAAAYAAASAAGVPVLGICRGLQAINVFSGGRLLQHLDGHESEPYPSPAVVRHPLGVLPGTRLASILGGAAPLSVNSYHHQAVTIDRLAPGLRASALTGQGAAAVVEALEAADPDRWLLAIQCHPERTESSPAELGALWIAFVAAAQRGRPAGGARRGARA